MSEQGDSYEEEEEEYEDDVSIVGGDQGDSINVNRAPGEGGSQ